MARIRQLLASVGLACDYITDSAAMSLAPAQDGLFVLGAPVTPGFTHAHERARCLNLQIVLDDGSIALGDCLSVIRAGSHDRAAPLVPEHHLDMVAHRLAPALEGLEVDGFRSMAARIADLEPDGRPLHPAIAYGLSQAMLDATALAERRTMAEVLADEYDLLRPTAPVPIFGCADARLPETVDRIIAGRADALPHGGFTSVDAIGTHGEKLVEFVACMSQRVQRHSDPSHRPALHVDVYGTIGDICGGDVERVRDYLRRLIEAAAPFRLRVEDPIGAGSAQRSRDVMRRLVALIDEDGLAVDVVADEHCNTREDISTWADERAAHIIHVKLPDLGSLSHAVEAALHCRDAGVGAYIGGTMNDTEVSGRASVHVALAVRAELLMAKPGGWPDVAIALTRNEMNRALRVSATR